MNWTAFIFIFVGVFLVGWAIFYPNEKESTNETLLSEYWISGPDCAIHFYHLIDDNWYAALYRDKELVHRVSGASEAEVTIMILRWAKDNPRVAPSEDED